MKTPIIRINSTEDIDLSKITLYDLNNRYVDAKGDMYCLNLDMSTKKIKIIRIIRTLATEEKSMKQQILQQRFINRLTAPEKKEEEVIEETETDDDSFEPYSILSEALSFMESHKERIRNIILNIKNSSLFSRGKKDDIMDLETMFRNLDLDGIQQIEKVIAYEKELSQYPRSITYYQAKIDNKARILIEQMGSNNEKIMKFIHFYEMYHAIIKAYKTLKQMLTELYAFINTRQGGENAQTNHNEIRAFQDAKTSIGSTLVEADEIMKKMSPFEIRLKTGKI